MQTNSSLSTYGVRRKGCELFVRGKASWETFSRVSYVANKKDKHEGTRDKLSIQIQTRFEFEWLTNQLYPSILAHKSGREKDFAWEKIHEKFLLVNSNGRRDLRWCRDSNLNGGLILIEPT